MGGHEDRPFLYRGRYRVRSRARSGNRASVRRVFLRRASVRIRHQISLSPRPWMGSHRRVVGRSAARARIGGRRENRANIDIDLADIRPTILLLMLGTAIAAILSGCLGAYLVASGRAAVPGGWGPIIPSTKTRRLLRCWAHLASYRFGILGGISSLAIRYGGVYGRVGFYPCEVPILRRVGNQP